MDRSVSLVRAGLVALVFALVAPVVAAQPLPERPTSPGPAPLSSSEVTDAEVESAAEIVVTMEVQQKKLEEEYGDPETMSTAERRKAQREIVRRRQSLLQKKTIQEDLDAGRFELIMISAQKDSTLQERVHTVLQKKRNERKQNGKL